MVHYTEYTANICLRNIRLLRLLHVLVRFSVELPVLCKAKGLCNLYTGKAANQL